MLRGAQPSSGMAVASARTAHQLVGSSSLLRARHSIGRLGVLRRRQMNSAGGTPASLPDAGAFIDRTTLHGASEGPLAGVSFAAKDNFDVKGQKTGAGNPVWLAKQLNAAETAPAVQALLDAGGALIGKTHMDELAYSLNGENAHYGTPVNSAAPDRIPGGSSSGSAAAVASNSVPLSLGTDTAGSVRVPASYCGLLGFRPTHGRVNIDRCVPLAQAFDTVGWFTRDPALLRQAGEVLLGGEGTGSHSEGCRWLVATDAFDLSDDTTRQAVYDAMSVDFAGVTGILGPPKEIEVASLEDAGTLEDWLDVFRVIQASEAWANHGEWISLASPGFGPGVKERFEAAAQVTKAEVKEAVAMRSRISDHVSSLLGSDGVLAVPTCPGPAPKLNTPPEELEKFRRRLLSLSALAPLCGMPQVTLPIADVDGAPVGLSLIGPRNSDEQLLLLAERLMLIMPMAVGQAKVGNAA